MFKSFSVTSNTSRVIDLVVQYNEEQVYCDFFCILVKIVYVIVTVFHVDSFGLVLRLFLSSRILKTVMSFLFGIENHDHTKIFGAWFVHFVA